MEKVAAEYRGSLSGLCPWGGAGVRCWGSAAHVVPPVALAASGASSSNMDAVGPCQCLTPVDSSRLESDTCCARAKGGLCTRNEGGEDKAG